MVVCNVGCNQILAVCPDFAGDIKTTEMGMARIKTDSGIACKSLDYFQQLRMF